LLVPGSGSLKDFSGQVAVYQGHTAPWEPEAEKEFIVFEGDHHVDKGVSDAEDAFGSFIVEQSHRSEIFRKNIFFVRKSLYFCTALLKLVHFKK